MPQQHKKVLAVVSDLFFSVKITDAAKRAGMAVELVKDPHELMIKAKAKPSVIIFDLNFEDAQPLELIAKLKGSAGVQGREPDRLFVSRAGRAEAGRAGGGLRYGDGEFGVLAESTADSEAALRRNLVVGRTSRSARVLQDPLCLRKLH